MKRSRSRFRRFVLITLLVVFLLLVVKVALVGAAVLELSHAVTALQTSLNTEDESALTSAINRFGSSAERTLGETAFAMPLVSLLGADGCVAARAHEIGSALTPLVDALAPLAPRMMAVVETIGSSSIDLSPLLEVYPAERLKASAPSLGGLMARPRCQGASPRFAALQEALDGVLFASEALFDAPLPDLLAGSSHWLIILNNSDELRATGGFSTALIDVRIEEGVLRWEFLNSYSVDNMERLIYHPLPPFPLQDFMGLEYWMFRDANWSPDHPATARMAARIYSLDREMPLPDGVISVNMSALPTLTRYLPTLEVAGAPFGSENALDGLREAWNEDAPLWNSYAEERKDFLLDYAAQLGNAILNQTSLLEKARLGLAVREMLLRRDVMIYAQDEGVNGWFAARGWNGNLVQTSGDYLMLVDTNLGYNKVTPLVTRQIDYAIDLSTMGVQLNIAYENTNTDPVPCTIWHRGWIEGVETLDPVPTYTDRMTGCYWNYVRIFVPPGSQMRGFQSYSYPGNWFAFTDTPHQARIDAFSEGGYDGYGTMLVLPPAETRDVQFVYTLPKTLVDTAGESSIYRFFIQKQAGAPNPDLRIAIGLPPDSGIRSISAPVESVIDGETIRLEGVLETDWQIEVEYQP